MDYNDGEELHKYQWDLVQDPQGMWFASFIDEEEAAMETDEFQQLLQILSYSGVNTFAFGIKCESEISDGNSFYVNGYRYYIFSYSYDEEQTININQITSEDFPGQELYSSVSVPDFVIPSELDKLLILNKEVNSTIVPFLCDVTEDYPNACGVVNLEDIEGFYDKLGSDISNCIIENALNPAVELSLEEIKGILLDLQTYARENQQFEFKHGGVVHRLNSQNQLETLESPESNEAINAGLWENNSIEMKMRLSYNTDGILQFEALGIHKNLPLAEGKTARLTDISSNLLEKSNTLLKQQQVENVNTTLNDVGANLDSEKFPDGKKVNINKDASFFKILSEAGGVGLTLLKTAEIEEPVYLSDVDNTIKGPPICTGSIEGGAMAVTDITSMVTMVHDLVTDKQARQKAKEGFKSIKEKVKDDPSLLFSILGEIALEELTGSNSQDFEDMCNNETNKGKKGHLVSKTSVRTATSVLATGKFLAKLPDMARKMALKMPKAKLWVRFKKLDKDLAEDLLNKLDELEDGGNKFLDDFIEAPNETLNKFLNSPELIDAWKKMDELNADDAIRQNVGAIEALSYKINGEINKIPEPSDYLDANYISNHLSKFNDEASFLVPEEAYNNFIKNSQKIGYPDGQFISTRKSIDEILEKAKGDISIIEDELGITPGAWQGQGNKIYRIDLNKIDDNLDLRIPKGSENGAGDKWIPGGYTPQKNPEAVVNQIPNTKEYVNKYPVIEN
jgi:hypothetical protein